MPVVISHARESSLESAEGSQWLCRCAAEREVAGTIPVAFLRGRNARTFVHWFGDTLQNSQLVNVHLESFHCALSGR